MYLDPRSKSYVVIGTLYGGGYDCGNERVYSHEGSKNGLWNKVSIRVDYIKEVMKDMGETLCEKSN